ncbi:MAG TPA: signal peptidase I [Mycobacteriales bacterium]|nr:signal peptidase I [Mycobacteriales bacterium]
MSTDNPGGYGDAVESPTAMDPVATDPGSPEPASTDPTAAGPERADKRKQASFLKELPFLILIALVLALLIKAFLVQAFYIPSGSMEQTLHIKDRVLVNKLVYRFRDPHRGEIIVFQGPSDWNAEFASPVTSNPIARFFQGIGRVIGVSPPSGRDFIKRVIGLPGDVVQCCNAQNQITVNGIALNEPYIYLAQADPQQAYQPFKVTVPAGHLWVMGDHRDDSADSRAHMGDAANGSIPISNVIGRAFVVVWPASRWGLLSVPSTFGQPGLKAKAAAVAVANAPVALGLVGAVPMVGIRRRWRRRRGRRAAR